MSARPHVLAVHLEDYFQGGPLHQAVPHRHWPRFETRVEASTHAALDLLDTHDQRATFFTSGWLAERLPQVLREVAARGHEIASKGHAQRTQAELDGATFRADVRRARHAIEQAVGRQVLGHRMARGWRRHDAGWLLDILAEEGFAYDASLRPAGWRIAEGLSRPHRRGAAGRELWVLPASVAALGPLQLPIAGGNYIRQLPHAAMLHLADRVARQASPLMAYFHVWELDAAQPRIASAGRVSRLRQYRNLDQMPQRITDYLVRYRFGSAAEYLGLDAEARTAHTAEAAIASAPRQMPAQAVSIVVPCYNEQASLGFLANTLARFAAEHAAFALSYVFVDDGSSDDTWAQLHRTFGNWPRTRLIKHAGNRGVAAATLTGVSAAPDEAVAVIDCDCTYDPAHLAVMVPLLTPDVALVTASPYHPDGAALNVPAWRLMLSRGLSWLYRRRLRTQLATYTACFRVYRRSALAGVTIGDGGFLGIVQILEALDRRGLRIVECPAVLESRLLGRSKMKVARTIVAHLRFLARLSAARRLPHRSTVRELAE